MWTIRDPISPSHSSHTGNRRNSLTIINTANPGRGKELGFKKGVKEGIHDVCETIVIGSVLKNQGQSTRSSRKRFGLHSSSVPSWQE